MSDFAHSAGSQAVVAPGVPMMSFFDGIMSDVLKTGCVRLFDAGASDIRIQSDDFVFAYINRAWVRVSDRRLEDGEVRLLIPEFYRSHAALGILGDGTPLDFELTIQPDPIGNPDFTLRCRANISRARVGNVSEGFSIVLRTIPGLPREWSSLQIEDEITENFFPSQGLVLVIGITGSGKSTLLSSAMRYRIETLKAPVAIGSYEEPIEYIYPRLPRGEMPEVSQSQIGTQLSSFDLVAPNVLRRKFDVVLVGEMRDKKSVETAVQVSDTGHATYATLHAETPATAFPRIIGEFPYDSQPSIANKLLDNTKLIVAQKIVPTTRGKGMAFRSWCVFDRALKEELRMHEHFQWSKLIRERMEAGRSSFEHRALPAFRDGILDMDGFMAVSGMNRREAAAFIEANP